MLTAGDLATLERLGVLEGRPEPRSAQSLHTLAEDGHLRHSLRVALDVQPDECFGALCDQLGGPARRVRVFDVRALDDPHVYELFVSSAGTEHRWEVEGVPSLVGHLNELFVDARAVRACAVLGEWREALTLWCLDRRALGGLWSEAWFAPENRRALARMR